MYQHTSTDTSKASLYGVIALVCYSTIIIFIGRDWMLIWELTASRIPIGTLLYPSNHWGHRRQGIIHASPFSMPVRYSCLHLRRPGYDRHIPVRTGSVIVWWAYLLKRKLPSQAPVAPGAPSVAGADASIIGGARYEPSGGEFPTRPVGRNQGIEVG